MYSGGDQLKTDLNLSLEALLLQRFSNKAIKLLIHYAALAPQRQAISLPSQNSAIHLTMS